MKGRLIDSDRIIVRAPSWLGDFVMAEPIVRALCERGAERVAIAAPERLLGLIDARFPNAVRLPISTHAPERARTYEGRDCALLLNGSFQSAWSAWSAGVPLRAGFARGGRAPLLTHAIVPARERGGVPAGLGRAGPFPRALPRPFGAACVELAGAIGLTVRARVPRLLVSDRARDRTNERLMGAGLASGERFVLVNAGSRPGSAKGCPPESLSVTLDALARSVACPFVIACAPGEEESARATVALVRRARKIALVEPAVDLAELVFLSSAAALVLTTDNGARHVAQAFATPTLVLCGPTDPRHTAEHPANVRVVRVRVPCGPCHRERCPLQGESHHACMTRIDPAEIVRAAEELLATPVAIR